MDPTEETAPRPAVRHVRATIVHLSEIPIGRDLHGSSRTMFVEPPSSFTSSRSQPYRHRLRR